MWVCGRKTGRAGRAAEVLVGRTDPALGLWAGEMWWDARGWVFVCSCLFCLPRPTRLHVVTWNGVRTTTSSLPALTAVLTAYTRLIFAHEAAPESEGDSLPVLSASIELCATMRRIGSDGTPDEPAPPLKAESEENQDRIFFCRRRQILNDRLILQVLGDVMQENLLAWG